VYAELHETLTIAEFRAVKAWYIADLLKVDRSAVQYALTDLVDRGYLERGDMLGNCFTFRIAHRTTALKPRRPRELRSRRLCDRVTHCPSKP
jgi:DNA-binding IclR family transcriptional regulator